MKKEPKLKRQRKRKFLRKAKNKTKIILKIKKHCPSHAHMGSVYGPYGARVRPLFIYQI